MKHVADKILASVRQAYHDQYLRLRSVVDVSYYTLYVLNPQFWFWASTGIALSFLSLVFPRELGGLPGGILVSLFVAVAFLLVQHLRTASQDQIKSLEVGTNQKAAAILRKLVPSRAASDDGFVVVQPSDHVKDGPVCLSRDVNRNQMAESSWNPVLAIADDRDRYDEIVRQLRTDSAMLRKYLWQKFKKAIFTERPLINEPKIGFSGRVGSLTTTVPLYRTDYFTGMCTADLTMSYFWVKGHNGVSRDELIGIDRAPIRTAGERTELLDFDDTSPVCSIHGGVEVLAVSADNYLRLAIQNKNAMVSQQMRAPTGSGSMDWDDRAGITTLKALIEATARRELGEEQGFVLGVRRSAKIKIERMQTIGYFRMPHRGGKPQFVVLAKLKNPLVELSNDPTEVDVNNDEKSNCLHRVDDLASLSAALDRILGGNSIHQDSVPLFGAVLCLKYLIEDRPEVVSSILGYGPPIPIADEPPDAPATPPRTRRRPKAKA